MKATVRSVAACCVLVLWLSPTAGSAERGSQGYSLKELERFYVVVESDVPGVSGEIVQGALEAEVVRPVEGAPLTPRIGLIDGADYRAALKAGTRDVARLRLIVTPVEGSDVLEWTLQVEQAVRLMRSKGLRPFVATTWQARYHAPVRGRGEAIATLSDAFRAVWWKYQKPQQGADID